jgi:hypothetical protein
MTKLTLTLSAALLVLGALALPASAQNEQRGAASIHALKNATPIVRPAARSRSRTASPLHYFCRP